MFDILYDLATGATGVPDGGFKHHGADRDDGHDRDVRAHGGELAPSSLQLICTRSHTERKTT
mgnify:CR=1 FL=1